MLIMTLIKIRNRLQGTLCNLFFHSRKSQDILGEMAYEICSYQCSGIMETKR